MERLPQKSKQMENLESNFLTISEAEFGSRNVGHRSSWQESMEEVVFQKRTPIGLDDEDIIFKIGP